VNLEALLPEVLPHVKGCPDFLAIDHLREAARELCRRAHIWSVTLASFNTVVGTVQYTMPLPAESSAVRLFRVDVGDQLDMLLLDESAASNEVAHGSQSAFAWLAGDKLNVNPKPTAIVPVVVELSLKPSASGLTLPDWIGEDWRIALARGARGTLFEMKGSDWFDPAMADFNTGKFNGQVTTAAITKSKGRATARRRLTTLF